MIPNYKDHVGGRTLAVLDGGLNRNQRADDRTQKAWRQNGAYVNSWVEAGTQKVRSGVVDSGGNGDGEEKLRVPMP